MALSERIGTRHRAALGITEDTDAVAVVVSEENGQMSVVERARIVRVPTEAQLERALDRPARGARRPAGPEQRRGPMFRGRTRGRLRIRTTPPPAAGSSPGGSPSQASTVVPEPRPVEPGDPRAEWRTGAGSDPRDGRRRRGARPAATAVARR